MKKLFDKGLAGKLLAAGLLSLGLLGTEKAVSASTYDFIIRDCDWDEAFRDCISRGGHLATLDTENEYQTVIGILESNSYYQNKVFFIGGRRESGGGLDYRWVDKNDRMYGDILNMNGTEDGPLSSWAKWYWFSTEPSFSDGGIDETVMSVFKYQGMWGFNDEPRYGLLSIAPNYSGILGYICEYEDPAQDGYLTKDPNASNTMQNQYTYSDPNTSNTLQNEYAYSDPNASNTLQNGYADTGDSQILYEFGSSTDYRQIYDGALRDAEARHAAMDYAQVPDNPYYWLQYTLGDATGDGIPELFVNAHIDKHGANLLVYHYDGQYVSFAGSYEMDLYQAVSIPCYDDGFIYEHSYKGSYTLEYYRWNGASFDREQILDTYDGNWYESDNTNSLYNYFDAARVVPTPPMADFYDDSVFYMF